MERSGEEGHPAYQANPPSPPAISPTTVNVAGPTMVFADQSSGPPFIVRALWYLFVGWWLAAFVIALGYVLVATIVGIPLGFALFNVIPQALTLRPRTRRFQAKTTGDVMYVGPGHEEQRPWLTRAIYFVLIGWWFGAVWLTLAWLIGLLIVTLPISFMMYNRTGGVMTLHRH